jgi:hypothetical protein
MRKRKPPTTQTPVYGMTGLSSLNQQTAPLANKSGISTSGPFTGSHMQQYGTAKPASRAYGTGSGDRSRGAFAQHSGMQQSNQYQQAMEDANRQFGQQAEKARSQDIFAQRADQVRRYGLDEGYKSDRRGIELQEREEGRNIRARVSEARRERDADMRNSILGTLFGGGVMSSLGNARIASQAGRPFFGNNLMGSGFGGMWGGGFNGFF